MAETKTLKNNKNGEYDFRRETLYPACAIFCVVVFIFFLVAMAVGINVTETETEMVTVIDGGAGTNDTSSDVPTPDALPVQTLAGIFLFAFTLMLLGQLHKLEYSALVIRMAHFVLTVLAFFVFILALPGYMSDAGLPAAIVACAAVSAVYFIIFGISRLVLKIKPLFGERANKVKAFIMPVFAIFTLLVFAVSFFNLISQVNVVVKEVIEEVWEADDKVRTTYVRVATPLAPTLQNYLRYLFSGIVFMIGYMILKMKLHPVMKGVLNFVILTAGYVGIWIAGMDYFSMFKANMLPAVVAYLATYAVVLIAVCVVIIVKRKALEEEEEAEFFRRSRK